MSPEISFKDQSEKKEKKIIKKLLSVKFLTINWKGNMSIAEREWKEAYGKIKKGKLLKILSIQNIYVWCIFFHIFSICSLETFFITMNTARGCCKFFIRHYDIFTSVSIFTFNPLMTLIFWHLIFAFFFFPNVISSLPPEPLITLYTISLYTYKKTWQLFQEGDKYEFRIEYVRKKNKEIEIESDVIPFLRWETNSDEKGRIFDGVEGCVIRSKKKKDGFMSTLDLKEKKPKGIETWRKKKTNKQISFAKNASWYYFSFLSRITKLSYFHVSWFYIPFFDSNNSAFGIFFLLL
jgi:hypothetical protein